MKFLKHRILHYLLLLAVLASCDNDPNPVVPVGASGYFVVNEGLFNNGNTSISFYDRASDKLTNDIFTAKNGRPLGDQAQSLTVFEGKAYVVVQNSAKIEVINADDYSSIQAITEGIENPRYFLAVSSSKAYVSDWGKTGIKGTVKVIDLTTNKVTKTIETGQGANKMVLKDNMVYVANSGGFGYDNTVAVINSTTDEIVTKIAVGDNPGSLQIDKDGNVWVAAGGATAYDEDWNVDEAASTKPSLSRIGSDNKESLRLTFSAISYSSLGLEINPGKDILYYKYDGAVYAMPITSTALPTTKFISKNFYGLSVDPFDGSVIGTTAPNFNSAGSVEVYTATGTLSKTMTAGIAPNGAYFK